MRTRCVILGVPVDCSKMTDTLDQLEYLIEDGRASRKWHQVATINVDFITNAIYDPELMGLLQRASLAMPDGMPVVWAGRLLGAPIDERVAGVDMVLGLAERAAQKGYSIFLLGAAPGVADRTAQLLQDRYAGLKIAGVSAPDIRSVYETDPHILEEIKIARPDILLVAFGNPKQEKWIGRYGDDLRVPVMIGVGGSFDLISGFKKRAPQWMQKSGLEWTYRLLQEPGRLWRRYGRNLTVFSWQFIRQWAMLGSLRTMQPLLRKPARQEMVLPQEMIGLKLPENVQISYSGMQDVFVDFSEVDTIDSLELGTLLTWVCQVREQGGELVLVNVPPKIERVLVLLQLEAFFCFHRGSIATQQLLSDHDVSMGMVRERERTLVVAQYDMSEPQSSVER